MEKTKKCQSESEIAQQTTTTDEPSEENKKEPYLPPVITENCVMLEHSILEFPAKAYIKPVEKEHE